MVNKIKNLFLSFVSFLFLSISPLAAQELLTVSKIVIKNAQWLTPTNGTAPIILSYELEMELDRTHTMESSLNRIDHPSLRAPYDFIHEGDEVELLQEGYISNNNNRSWFRVFHPSSSVEFDAQGPSIKPKIILPIEYPIVEIKDVRIDNATTLSFMIDGLFVQVPITSDKYHGWYEGMPLLIHESSKTDADLFGRYQYVLLAENMETHQVLELKSYNYTLNNTVTIDTLQATGIKGIGHSFYHELYRFNLKFLLDNGSEYVTPHTYSVPIGGTDPVNAFIQHKIASMGKELTILEEKADPHNGRFAYFKFYSSKDGSITDVYGPLRKDPKG